MSLLQKAKPAATRLKAYIYGDSGTGKTITALSFPSPAVIDAEDGTLHYGKYKEFLVRYTSDIDEIHAVVDELLADPQGVKSFVLDPFTAVYEKLLIQTENRLKAKKNDPRYTLQPMDYRYIVSAVKNLIHKLLALDLNVIVTARSAIDYAKDGFMQAVGTKAEGPKQMPYMFDVVLELYIDPNTGARIANVKKDRTNTLPPTFEFNYQAFVNYMGIEGLEREPIVINQKAALESKLGRNIEINYQGSVLKTAGINAENLAILAKLSEKIGVDKVKAKLKEDYGVESLLDLGNSEATLLITNLESLQ